MGSLAPHDPPANGQANQQWVTDARSQCVAADPSYRPDDTIAWQGKCRKDGVIYGEGTLTFLNAGQTIETITGTFRDGLLQPGPATATWSDGTKYQGGQFDGLFDGAGKFVSAKGETLDGDWKMGVFQTGKANVVWPNGDHYDGELKNGKPDGEGVEIWADGRRYEGQWRDGIPVGDAHANGNGSSAASDAPVALNVAAPASAQPPAQGTSMLQPASTTPASSVAPATATLVAATAFVPPAAGGNGGNAAPNPALPLRAELGTPLTAVDGATLDLALTDDGFERTLVLPNGNSQQVGFAFANGPVGTVSDGERSIGVFRAKPNELDIDYADGSSETIGEGTGGGLIDRAKSVDGHAMCTAWYPQGHVFSQSEKQAAVQEYASRLGLSVSAPSKKLHAHDAGHDASPACGGAFIASGSQQKAAGAVTEDGGAPKAVVAPADHAQSGIHASKPHTAELESGVVAVPTSTVHLIDEPSAHVEKASFAPDQSASSVVDAVSTAPAPQPGASDCLTVTSNGEYWGFQNRCAKTVQFSYCEMSDGNPLTSCKRTSVAGSVAANGFSALVSDRSLAEKNAEHEFRWMACDGGAGEVVPHLDKIDPPSGRCERAVAVPE